MKKSFLDKLFDNNARSRRIGYKLFGIMGIVIGPLLLWGLLSGKLSSDFSGGKRVFAFLLALAFIAEGIYELTHDPEKKRSKIGYDEKKVEKLRDRREIWASKGIKFTLETAIRTWTFSPAHEKYWKALLECAAAAGVSEQELIADSALGEVFSDVTAVISVGREYTAYCMPLKNGQLVLRNDTARRIYRKIEKTDVYFNGIYSNTESKFFIMFDNGKKVYKMRCEENCDRFILDAYERTGMIPAGVIEYPSDTPPQSN